MKKLVAVEMMKELITVGKQITEYEPGRKQIKNSLQLGHDLFHTFSKQARKSWQRNQILFRNQYLFQSLIDNSFDIIAVVNSEGEIQYVSPSIKRILGYEPEQWIGKAHFNLIHPDDSQKFNITCSEMLQDPNQDSNNAASLELRIKHKDGSWRNIECAVTNLSNDTSVAGFVCNLHDVTDRKRAEQELQALFDRETEVRKVLEEERESRIEFTRVLVHELKTPLTPVMSCSEVLVSELQEGTIEKRLATSILHGALNLNSRVDELLDLAKCEIGKMQLKVDSLDLLQVLRKVADSVNPMLSSKNQSLVLDLPHSLPKVWADENRLQQIILNIINNSSKFTPDGGKITLSARKNGTTNIVEVQDTGKGITEEEQQRLFNPYFRVENDRQVLNGLGLGLALCKTLVDLHGGQIWVKSRQGEGSTFGFSIPFKGRSGEFANRQEKCLKVS